MYLSGHGWLNLPKQDSARQSRAFRNWLGAGGVAAGSQDNAVTDANTMRLGQGQTHWKGRLNRTSGHETLALTCVAACRGLRG